MQTDKSSIWQWKRKKRKKCEQWWGNLPPSWSVPGSSYSDEQRRRCSNLGRGAEGGSLCTWMFAFQREGEDTQVLEKMVLGGRFTLQRAEKGFRNISPAVMEIPVTPFRPQRLGMVSNALLSITWELDGNAESQAPPQTHWTQISDS